MRTVYATQFRVRPASGQPTSALVESLADRVWAWLGDRYTVKGEKLTPAFDGTPLEPRPDHRIVGSAEAIDDHALITVDWTYPHDPDPTALWLVQIIIAASGGKVEVAITIRISSVGFVVRPLGFILRRPNLLPDLFKRFNCTAGPQLLTNTPKALDVLDVEPYVNDVLRNPARTLPVVLVSPVVWDDKPLVDAGKLQDELTGLALVTELTSKWAGFRLSEAVGGQYSCYNGAVRLYWPGFKVEGEENLAHTLYLPGYLEKLEEKGWGVGRQLFRQLAAVAAFRHTEGDVITRARVALDGDRRARLNELIERARASPAGDPVDAELLQLALSENERLEREVKKQQDRVSELERDLATAQVNFEAMSQYQQSGDPTDEGDSEKLESTQIESVVDALRMVSEKNPERLRVFKTAWESAKASDFSRPDDALKGLLAIVEIGEQYFANKGKKSIGPLEDLFEQRSVKYAPTESQNTLNMYGDERKFSNAGVKKQMLKHIRIGAGDTKNCLQIYFEFNDDTKQIEIGHCGRHLSYYGQKT